jgi:hypothetical protein
MRDRKYRRQQAAETKRRAAMIHPWIDATDPRAIGKAATTPVRCSCECCGNPRHHRRGAERLTMQERRAQEVTQ